MKNRAVVFKERFVIADKCVVCTTWHTLMSANSLQIPWHETCKMFSVHNNYN
ncbi:hypothetical protein MBAV_004430 [Candidatus Magnetobacterium bavaricum]|uniref:Uncharacterized protein n=1 Tax=Candidatus Magnetobacterium bavaricum TaxID=29290 RepID=A0A0F3GN38_9BACT|nr:hypothetical protein MBAV_004430 [Candidatus Magnetobacterium bavaricum]